MCIHINHIFENGRKSLVRLLENSLTIFLLCACIKYSPIIAIWYKSHLQSKRVSLYRNKTKINVYEFIKKLNNGNNVKHFFLQTSTPVGLGRAEHLTVLSTHSGIWILSQLPSACSLMQVLTFPSCTLSLGTQ